MVPERPLDPRMVEDCHRAYRDSLERYAWAIVRDWSLAADAVQNGFLALSRFGGDVPPEAIKSWLYRVVHREAMRLREGQQKHQKLATDAELVREVEAGYEINPLATIERDETRKQLRASLEDLPPEQLEVVRLRIYENQTFVQIAERLKIPLGTALSRMRLALERLRGKHGD